jgi:hypothetical protein
LVLEVVVGRPFVNPFHAADALRRSRRLSPAELTVGSPG